MINFVPTCYVNKKISLSTKQRKKNIEGIHVVFLFAEAILDVRSFSNRNNFIRKKQKLDFLRNFKYVPITNL